MKARTLKKKVSTKQAKKNWSHSQNNRNVLSFFFSLSSSLQAEEKQPGWTA